MKAKVNELPQQAKLTTVTKGDINPKLLKTIKETRYQLLARIATRVLLQGK